MTNEKLTRILETVRKTGPLVHCITNYVTVNDVANIVLACGASPIMADDKAEAACITALCSATYINIGTLNARTVDSMLLAGKTAEELHHPVVLDPVGAGASPFRTETVGRLMNSIQFTVIRGNMSEIKTIAQGGGTTKGVDADAADTVTEENLDDAVGFVRKLAGRAGSVVAVTGAIDIISDADRTYVCRNGHPMLKSITGSGCMLGAVVAAFCGANPGSPLEAAAAAVSAMGLCGERAYRKTAAAGAGTGSFRAYLIDEMSLLTPQFFAEGCRIEER
ncbi:MAG TPA: hydroxyethylthiazole kinase [Treponema sp.]|mgnify:CR=1 FL=1|nr:hydroxyethylthiazole kinase [Treponema sp.]